MIRIARSMTQLVATIKTKIQRPSDPSTNKQTIQKNYHARFHGLVTHWLWLNPKGSFALQLELTASNRKNQPLLKDSPVSALPSRLFFPQLSLI
jgi:hypothetical protein